MKTPEQAELEDMALAAELARQLCHDFNNFLYGLFLRIEIAKASPLNTKAIESDAVKQEREKLVAHLREWEQFNRRFSYDEAILDLHQVIREMDYARSSSPDHAVQLAPSISAEPLPAVGSATVFRHLMRFLIEDIYHTWRTAEGRSPLVSIQTEISNGSPRVRIIAQRPSDEAQGKVKNGDLAREETAHSSLVADTCQSLALRLGATLHCEWLTDGRYVIQVAFPSP